MLLDNLMKISEIDSQNMFKLVYKWPELIEDILIRSLEIPVEVIIGKYIISYTKNYSNILICGMGGSAISGEYLRDLFEQKINVPLIIQKQYNLPSFVSKNTLLILISYSGNTEETISCLIQAIKKSAQIVGVGSGGVLGNFFKKNKLPFFSITSGYQPRVSLPLLFFPFLKILNELGLIRIENSAINETIMILKQQREEFKPENNLTSNKAKQYASQIKNKIPIIWSHFHSVANRMKCQLNENAKNQAFAEDMPELCHNHLVGFENYSSTNPFIVIILRFDSEHPNIKSRFDITQEILTKKIPFITINAKGNSLLAQLFYITYLGDYISMYLAVLNNRDPNLVESIDRLKKELDIRNQTLNRLIKNLNLLSEVKI